MKTIHYVLLTIAGAIVLLAIFNWDKISSLWAGNNPPKGHSEGSDCTTADGKAGTIMNGVCVAKPIEGSPCTTADGKAGTIVEGVCKAKTVSPTTFSQIRITNPNGAKVSINTTGRLMAPQTPKVIPFGTVLTVTEYVSTPNVFYNTAQGWVSGNDAEIIPV